MDLTQKKAAIAEELAQYNFDDFSDRLRFLHRQLAVPDPSQDSQFRIYLEAGCLMLGAVSGFICFSAGAVFRRVAAFDRETGGFNSHLLPSYETVFQRVTEQGKTCRGVIEPGDGALSSLQPRSQAHQLENQPPESLPSYYVSSAQSSSDHPMQRVGFVGTPLIVSNNRVGVLCFTSTTGFQLSNSDIESLELMAEGVARMIELQAAKEKTKLEDTGFAVPGVKSLEEYIYQATIPELYGVSGRVIEVLQRRIGGMPLSIDHVADELKLSKRTLQRRLQQQDASFAQLRDQVRYHHAINYLTRHTLSIDSISSALDFSDRTSFTNAFKRWTSLSPSTFRKLFRDYA